MEKTNVDELTNAASLISVPDVVLGNVLNFLPARSAYQVGYSCQALLQQLLSMESLLFETVKIPFNMSDKGLESFLIRCNAKNRSRSIDLSYCRHVAGSGLRSLHGSSVLEVVDIRSMPSLSYTCVLPIFRSMSSLWSVGCSVKPNRKGNKKISLPEGYHDLWKLRDEVFGRKAAREDTWQCMVCQSSDVVARCHKNDCTKMVCQAHSVAEGHICPDCSTWVCSDCRFCSECFACEKCRVETEECGNCENRLCYKCYTRCQDCGHIECGCETLLYCISCGISPLEYNGKIKDYGGAPVPTMSAWHVKSMHSVWNGRLQLIGRVSGHSTFLDGEEVATTQMVAGNLATGFEITTNSGSRYYLGRKLESTGKDEGSGEDSAWGVLRKVLEESLIGLMPSEMRTKWWLAAVTAEKVIKNKNNLVVRSCPIIHSTECKFAPPTW